MSLRHESRLMAVQFLFQRDFNAGALDEDLQLFFAAQEGAEKARPFAEELARGVEANKADLDARLQQAAANWDLRRMGAVERNVMRVALYEMLHRPDIPPVVSINEAIELCKELSSEESGSFVNGILDAIRRGLDRPARAAQVVNVNLRKRP